MVQPDRPEMTF